tara:strand:- start:1454 stop:3646 length:2193 start_codon:yes stop_codon:yes gene_type:complete
MLRKQKKKTTFKKRKKQSTDFIHFGCWNQGLCDMVEKGNPLSNVMFTLNEYINHINIDFITVAGDNYYPNKIKNSNGNKIKRIYDTNLKSGFDCLPNGKEIYMLLGNHDLETNLEKDPNIFIEDSDILEENCYILSKELEYSDSHKPPIKFVFNQSKLIDKTLILMIDTSLYSKNPEEYLQCYNNLLSKNLKSIEDIINIQSMFVLNSIKNNMGRFRNLVLIGHHPITGNKVKNGLKLIKPFKGFIDLFVDIYNMLGDTIHYNYLCADLHLHQEGYVKINDMVINQYIVGTGGTKLDDNSKVFQDRTITTVGGHTIVYDMVMSDKVYGFLHCSAQDGDFHCAFVNTLQKGGMKGGVYTEKELIAIKKENPILIQRILALSEPEYNGLTAEDQETYRQIKSLDSQGYFYNEPRRGAFNLKSKVAASNELQGIGNEASTQNIAVALPFFGIRYYESQDKGMYERDLLSKIQQVAREHGTTNQCVPAQADALTKIARGEQYENQDVSCPLLGSEYWTAPTPEAGSVLNSQLKEIGENCLGNPSSGFFRWNQAIEKFNPNFPLVLLMNIRDTFLKPLLDKYGREASKQGSMEYVFIPIVYDVGSKNERETSHEMPGYGHAMNIIIDLSYLKQKQKTEPDFWNVSIHTLPKNLYDDFIIECSRYITIFDKNHMKSTIPSWYNREIMLALTRYENFYMIMSYYPLISSGGVNGCTAHTLNIAGGSKNKKRTKKRYI